MGKKQSMQKYFSPQITILGVLTVLYMLQRYMHTKLRIFKAACLPIKYKIILSQISEHLLWADEATENE